MSEVTDLQRQTFREMQARLIALLLRHYERRFRHYFGERDWNQEVQEDARFRPYRELAVFFQLRDELFEHILPRIVRRLSFEAPRHVMVEDPPARGRVDWERTLSATWEERPGEAPLQVHTRQRRRHFATPQNLLTVATLLEYHDDAQRLLWDEQAPIGGQRLRHPLNEIVERCERELAFPQFAGLRADAQQIVERQEVSSLEAQVSERIIPGGNSAYQELLEWRRRRRELRLLRHDAQRDLEDTVGADPNRDNYLYQLWIFYELADFLSDRDCLDGFIVDPDNPGKISLQFRWGSGDSRRGYELRHDQHVPQQPARWTVTPQDGKDAVPGVRPDFYLRRIDPPMEQVEYKGAVYWREPGVVWDAKYYRDRERETTPSTPLKRMVADLNLLGEEYGALLFAFLKSDEGQSSLVSEISVESGKFDTLTTNAPFPFSRFTPLPGNDQTLIPNQQVTSWQVQPQGVSRTASVGGVLAALLDDAHQRLSRYRIPRCYGVFLDDLHARQLMRSGALVDRYGKPLATAPQDLLLCPKPHIGSWRTDVVSHKHHCLKDPGFCHIIGQLGAVKPVRPPRTAQDLVKALEQIVNQNLKDDSDMQGTQAVLKQLEEMTYSFAQYLGFDQSLESYIRRLPDLGLQRAVNLLGRAEQESLALSIFLREQLDNIHASDYRGPAIHISSVLERILQRLVFLCSDLKLPPTLAEKAHLEKATLGTLSFISGHPARTETDKLVWQYVESCACNHWHGLVDLDEPEITFLTLINQLAEIGTLRNKAAHTDPLTRDNYNTLRVLTCQKAGSLRYGALEALLLAWQ